MTSLHSTMSLLKLKAVVDFSCDVNDFTFHYVSIKTQSWRGSVQRYTSFTFHYVSIKTAFDRRSMLSTPGFTFHYVSIKTISVI